LYASPKLCKEIFDWGKKLRKLKMFKKLKRMDMD